MLRHARERRRSDPDATAYTAAALAVRVPERLAVGVSERLDVATREPDTVAVSRSVGDAESIDLAKSISLAGRISLPECLAERLARARGESLRGGTRSRASA